MVPGLEPAGLSLERDQERYQAGRRHLLCQVLELRAKKLQPADVQVLHLRTAAHHDLAPPDGAVHGRSCWHFWRTVT